VVTMRSELLSRYFYRTFVLLNRVTKDLLERNDFPLSFGGSDITMFQVSRFHLCYGFCSSGFPPTLQLCARFVSAQIR
jgi:hypothetical protein